jgi:sugar-specific transcriptional regulator TrmB
MDTNRYEMCPKPEKTAHNDSEEAEDIELLTNLGLKPSEAKIFLTLSYSEASTAATISQKSGIAREFVYQTIPKLVKKSLVEVIIAVPKKFKAVSMKDAYTTLLRRKEAENRKFFSRALKAIERHKNKTATQAPVDADPQTSLVPSKEAPDMRITQEYRNLKKSADLTFPMGKFLQWSQYYAEPSLKEVIQKKVKMRIITQQNLLRILTTQPKLFTRRLKSKLKHVDVRYVPKPFSVEMMIFDKKTLFISTTNESNINKMIWLRTNNPLILEMANGYFEAIWEKAKKSTDMALP